MARLRQLIDRPLLATGRDLYLMFKHEETPEGALYAVDLVKELSVTAA